MPAMQLAASLARLLTPTPLANHQHPNTTLAVVMPCKQHKHSWYMYIQLRTESHLQLYIHIYQDSVVKLDSAWVFKEVLNSW